MRGGGGGSRRSKGAVTLSWRYGDDAYPSLAFLSSLVGLYVSPDDTILKHYLLLCIMRLGGQVIGISCKTG